MSGPTYSWKQAALAEPLQDFLLPKIIDKLVHEGKAKVRVLDTPDKWFGVTYKEDKQAVVDAIKGLIDAGVYKEKLFD